MSARIDYEPDGRVGFSCQVRTDAEGSLMLSGPAGPDPTSVVGPDTLTANEALVTNLWAFGTQEFLHRRARSAEKRRSHLKQADHHRTLARGIADLVVQTGSRTRDAWCSSCFSFCTHTVVKGLRSPTAYLCAGCGSPMSKCAAPHCQSMANRGTAAAGVPRYCAEHRHDIPGFERLTTTFPSIDDYDAWLEFDKNNLAKATRISVGVAASAAVVIPGALAAAPAIGGIIGSSAVGGGLTGAAATSHGLALLGGGSLAAGGAGMAGGMTVVTASGAALGGMLGGAATTAYVRTDKSFRIEKLRGGTGPAVLVANGFLTEGTEGWGGWQPIVLARYPESPVYRVHWGSKELKAFGALSAVGSGKAAAARLATRLAARATRSGASKIPYLGALFTAGDVAANPWSVAVARAEMTGAVLADLIARTESQEFVLVGHSLGARVMVTAARALGTRAGAPRLRDVHLLGAAISTDKDWRTLNESVHGSVWNYYSNNDPVLSHLYRTAQFGAKAVGNVGFASTFPRLKDRNVSATVKSHSAYFEKVRLA